MKYVSMQSHLWRYVVLNSSLYKKAISEIFPELFEGFYNELLEVLSSKNKTVVNISLKILANIAKVLDVKDER